MEVIVQDCLRSQSQKFPSPPWYWPQYCYTYLYMHSHSWCGFNLCAKTILKVRVKPYIQCKHVDGLNTLDIVFRNVKPATGYRCRHAACLYVCITYRSVVTHRLTQPSHTRPVVSDGAQPLGAWGWTSRGPLGGPWWCKPSLRWNLGAKASGAAACVTAGRTWETVSVPLTRCGSLNTLNRCQWMWLMY